MKREQLIELSKRLLGPSQSGEEISLVAETAEERIEGLLAYLAIGDEESLTIALPGGGIRKVDASKLTRVAVVIGGRPSGVFVDDDAETKKRKKKKKKKNKKKGKE